MMPVSLQLSFRLLPPPHEVAMPISVERPMGATIEVESSRQKRNVKDSVEGVPKILWSSRTGVAVVVALSASILRFTKDRSDLLIVYSSRPDFLNYCIRVAAGKRASSRPPPRHPSGFYC